MKKSKKLFLIAITGFITTFATSCSSENSSAEKVYNVGICQLAQHEALDAATEGFQDYLYEKLDKNTISFNYQNASGDSNACSTIINGFVADNVDLIMANATASIQAAQSATADIPILGTSITDYAQALGIDGIKAGSPTGTNISGTTDLAPLSEQAEVLKELFPNSKNVGLVYCSAEPNSMYQIEVIKPILEDMGYKCTEFSFTDTNDVAAVVTTAATSSDVLYIPTDNVAASCKETIANIVIEEKIPVIAGEEKACQSFGVATLSIDYYELGRLTGEMAYKVLVEDEDISKLDIVSAPKFTKKYNPEMCEKLGIEIPDSYEEI